MNCPSSTVREVHVAGSAGHAGMLPRNAKISRIQLFSPCAIGFIGLAVLIFVWGTSSKLSLYNHHRDASRTTFIAKMWIEPRTANRVTVSRIRDPFHASGTLKGLQGSTWQNLLLVRAITHVSPERRIMQTDFSLLRPLRAPPTAA